MGIRRIFAALIFSFAATSASAALVTFSNVIDIAGCPTSPPNECSVNPPMPTVSIDVGDMVDQTVTFANGNRLRMFDDGAPSLERISAWLLATSSNFTISNITLDLLGFSGSGLSQVTAASESGGTLHIGPVFFANFADAGASISFNGYRVQYTVDALSPTPPIDYDSLWFIAQADRIAVQAIPEPGTYALMLAGLGLVVFVTARRRAAR